MRLPSLFYSSLPEDFEAIVAAQLKNLHIKVPGCWLQTNSDFMKAEGKIGSSGLK